MSYQLMSHKATRLLLFIIGLSQVGCGDSTPVTNSATTRPTQPQVRQTTSPPTQQSQAPVPTEPQQFRAPFSESSPPQGEKPRILGDLLNESERHPPSRPRPPVTKPRVIDDAKLTAAGVRKIPGRHLILYTDLPVNPAVDEIPQIYDLAVPMWCEYFDIEKAEVADWQLTGFVMNEKATFQALGLLPSDLPPFLHGYQRDNDLWAYEQPSDYYRRHLVLHEGTHGFMTKFLGGTGPPWYAEGMAERMGTHRWQDGQLTMGYMPPDKKETPHWGRIRLIKDDFQAGNARTLISAMKADARSFLQPKPYAWSWAATMFFENHALTAAAFRKMFSKAADTSDKFSGDLYTELKPQWPLIVEDWQLFVVEVDYGYDFARSAVVRIPADTVPNTTATIQADRGWQSTGFAVQAGMKYSFSAQGRYQIAQTDQTWWCEPGGVTIHYHNNLPVGMLMAAVRSDDWQGKGVTPLVQSVPIGLGGEFEFPASGTLYLRINEPSSGLKDNAGQLTVQIH